MTRGRQPAAREARGRVRRPLRTAGIVVGSAVAIWATLVATTASVWGSHYPDVTLGLGGSSAEAKAALAARAVSVEGTSEDRARASALAKAALRREPGNVSAVRTLGLLAALDNRAAEARRLFDYAESLSRRDLATQLWLVESKVADDDIHGALLHYDRAMRTSMRGRQLLIPILVQASSEREIAEPLARMIAGRPPWWTGFAYALATAGSPDAIMRVLAALKLDSQNPEERQLLAAAIQRLASTGAYPQAHALYRSTGDDRDSADMFVRNGTFDSAGTLPPIDWELVDEPERSAARETVDSDQAQGNALRLVVNGGQGGTLARQLLFLPTGRYQLSARIGGGPIIALHCATASATDGAQLFTNDSVAASDTAPGTFSQHFTVSGPDCPAQWLTIGMRSDFGSGRRTAWVDSIAIVRR